MRLEIEGAKEEEQPVVVSLRKSGSSVVVEVTKGDKTNTILTISPDGIRRSRYVEGSFGFPRDWRFEQVALAGEDA